MPKRRLKWFATGLLLLPLSAGLGSASTFTATLTPSQTALDWPIQVTAGQRILAAVRCSDPATFVDVALVDPDNVVLRERRQPTGAHFLVTVRKTGAYHIHVLGQAIEAPVPVEFFLHYLPSNGR